MISDVGRESEEKTRLELTSRNEESLMLLPSRDASDRSDVVGSESYDPLSLVGVEVELVVDLRWK